MAGSRYRGHLQPKDGEIVAFSDHTQHGFCPSGSKFFRDVLHFLNLHLQDLGPNSIFNICNFQTLCEVYLQRAPSVELFYEYHYVNRQTESANGELMQLGGVAIQRRRDLPFLAAFLPSHPKTWNLTWFYCQDTSPEGENKLPGYRPTRLSKDTAFPDRLTPGDRKKYEPTMAKIRALVAHGLTGVDLARCWVSWRVMPLSRRDRLMYEYTGELDDPLCFSSDSVTAEDVNVTVKSILGEKMEVCCQEGLKPFYTKNPAPPADSDFWKKKVDPPVRRPKVKKTVTCRKKKTVGEKTAAEQLMDLEDTEDEPETSQADAPEWEPKRRTRSAGSEELMSGLPNTSAPRKRPVEGTAGSSGDSTASIAPPLKINPGAQAKRRKTAGSGSGTIAGATTSGPSIEPAPAAPALAEPETMVSAPVAPDSSAPSAEPATAEAGATIGAPPVSKPAVDDAAYPAPSSSTTGTSATPKVVVIGAAFNPPARHVLAKHTGEAGSSTPAKLELELLTLENLSADELHAGYLSRLNAHRSDKLKLVNLLKKKYEESVTGLRDAAAASQTAMGVAEEKLRAAVEKLSELEKELSTVQKTAENREAELIKRAEDVESRLKTVSVELAGLKNHVSRMAWMTEAIFGKKNRQLSSDSILKLKAVYTLTEQLYCGAVCTIKSMLGKKSIPDLLKGVLDLLSTLPQQICEIRKSAVRKGAIAALSRSLAYAPELTAEEMMGGFPSLKDDGSEFTDADYTKCLQASRVLASALAEETDFSTYQAAYDSDD